MDWPQKEGPLPFDRVMDGFPVAVGDSSLLGLPSELINSVVAYLDQIHPRHARLQTLAALAQVNSACRQLARSCQFESVRVDFQNQSPSGLLDCLVREWQDRSRGGRPSSPSLSASIRSVFISWLPMDGEVDNHQPQRIKPAEATEAILTLPHLESFGTLGSVFLDDRLASLLMQPKLRRLSLDRIRTHKDLQVELLEDAQVSLRSLWVGGPMGPGHSIVVSALVWASASSLEELRFKDFIDLAQYYGSGEVPTFSRLKRLTLEPCNVGDTSGLPDLLGSPALSTLQISGTNSHTGVWISVIEASPLPHLERLDVLAYLPMAQSYSETLLDTILRRNRHIQELALWTDNLFADGVLPAALSECNRLRTLTVRGEDMRMGKAALEQISQLPSLERLLLRGGRPHPSDFGRRDPDHAFMPDHEALAHHLRPLSRLRELRFARDYYRPGAGHGPLAYYTALHATDEEKAALGWAGGGARPPRSFKEARALCNAMRMEKHARRYAEALPRLELVSLGGETFRVEREAGESGRGIRLRSVAPWNGEAPPPAWTRYPWGEDD